MAIKKRKKPNVISIIITIVIVLALVFFLRPKPMQESKSIQEPQAAAPSEKPVFEVTKPPAEEPTGNPQLKVISFNSRPVIPKANDVVTFSLNVKNVGDLSPETEVEFFVNNESVGTGTLEPLDRNAVGVVKVSGWAVPSTGSYTAVARVRKVPGEMFTDDNTAKLTITVFE